MSEYDKDEKPGTEYGDTIIETSGVKVNFGDFWALKGIDISIRRGEIIVILGPSGSGKSTYIRTLNRLQPHNGGTIKIDGITVDDETSQIRSIRGWFRIPAVQSLPTPNYHGEYYASSDESQGHVEA